VNRETKLLNRFNAAILQDIETTPLITKSPRSVAPLYTSGFTFLVSHLFIKSFKEALKPLQAVLPASTVARY